MKTINDNLALIGGRTLRLQDTKIWDINADPHKPDLRLWPPSDISRMEQFVMSLSLSAIYGQQLRFVELTPDQARTLAQQLIAMADAMDATISDSIEADDGVSTP